MLSITLILRVIVRRKKFQDYISEKWCRLRGAVCAVGSERRNARSNGTRQAAALGPAPRFLGDPFLLSI